MFRNGALVVAVLLSLAAVRARAEVFTYHLDGQVSRIVDTSGGALQSALTLKQVQKDAAVSIDWTVDSSLGARPPATGSGESYIGVITSFTIQVGSWTATGSDIGFVQNKVTIIDHPAFPDPNYELDAIDMFRTGTDTDHLVDDNDPNGDQLILHLFDPSGRAGTGIALGEQTPALYPSLMGTVFGKNGEVDFTAVIASQPADTSGKCRSSQLAAAGALCKATLACLAANAKAPDKDPGDVKLDNCRAKADAKFVIAFDRAAATAASKGLTCGTTDTGAAAISHVDAAVDHVVALADTIDPPQPALVSGWYAAAGAMCSAAVKAESKNVTKPDPAKLEQLRTGARNKLTVAAGKALAKAESKGVVFDPEPDVAAFVASIDALIDDVVHEVNGL